MSEEDQLNERQRKFVQELVYGNCSQTEAARRAGFAQPAQAASRLLKEPKIISSRLEMQDDVAAQYGISAERSMRDLLNIRNGAIENGQYAAAVQAEKLRAHMGGLLNSKREDPVKMLTKEQLAKRIQEIENIANAKTVALEDTGDGVFTPKNLN